MDEDYISAESVYDRTLGKKQSELNDWQVVNATNLNKLTSLQVRMHGQLLYINLVTDNSSSIAENERLFSLPSSSRPAADQRFIVWSYSADKTYVITVKTNGDVVLYGKGTASTRLTGASVVYLGI